MFLLRPREIDMLPGSTRALLERPGEMLKRTLLDPGHSCVVPGQLITFFLMIAFEYCIILAAELEATYVDRKVILKEGLVRYDGQLSLRYSIYISVLRNFVVNIIPKVHLILHTILTMRSSSSLVGLVMAASSLAAPLEKRAKYDAPAGGDVTILNYALTLEYLERKFYQEGVANYTANDFHVAGCSETFYENLKEILYDEEVSHE